MQYPLPDRDYKVLTITYTYNQEKYIEDTLKGIVMQKTDFPFVALVLDDCSTDGTPDIIRRYEAQYPDIIKGIYQEENHFSQGKQQEEYIQPWRKHVVYQAFCEGDDYWTDPYKLQKQVDFMDSHPDCVLSFHNAIEHWEDGSKEDKLFSNVEEREYTGAELFKNWIVPTASVMSRTELSFREEMINNVLTPGFLYYDIVYFLSCGLYGKFFGMNETMSVYRRLNTGYTLNFQANYKKSQDLMRKYYHHNLLLGNIFGTYYGEEFLRETQKNCVETALNGAFLSLGNKDFKNCGSFLKSAFCPLRPIVLYFKYFIANLVILSKKRLHIDLVAIKNKLIH